jgi:hypothetical protein
MNMQRKQQNVMNGGSRALCNWAGMAPDVMESTSENQMLQTDSQWYSSSKTDVLHVFQITTNTHYVPANQKIW